MKFQILWKSYIDFEINAEEYEKARDLYECLLQKTNHIKVWISLAEFEQSIGRMDTARKVGICRFFTLYQKHIYWNRKSLNILEISWNLFKIFEFIDHDIRCILEVT